MLFCSMQYIRAAKLIHKADPQSRPLVIIVSAHIVRSSVRTSVPTFHTKQNKFQAKTGETVGLAEWIIDDTCLGSFSFLVNSHQLSRTLSVVCPIPSAFCFFSATSRTWTSSIVSIRLSRASPFLSEKWQKLIVQTHMYNQCTLHVTNHNKYDLKYACI